MYAIENHFKRWKSKIFSFKINYYVKNLEKDLDFVSAWSLFYINLRLKYPNVNAYKLHELALEKVRKGDMVKFIKDYILYIDKFLAKK